MMIYALMRYGVPLPEDHHLEVSCRSYATVVFFAIAGPITILLGAGHSLEQHGVLGVVSLLGLYHLTLWAFIGIGAGLIMLFAFPAVGRRLVRWLAGLVERRYPERATRLRALEDDVNRSQRVPGRVLPGAGLAGAGGGRVAHRARARKQARGGGYVVLRMLDIHAQFVDVILLQTLITFLLYFAPTARRFGPGRVGVGGRSCRFMCRGN